MNTYMLLLIGFCAAIVSGASLREKRATLPCRLNSDGDPEPNQSLISWLTKIESQMNTFKSRCKNIIQEILSTTCVEPSSMSYLNLNLSYPNAAAFMLECYNNDPSCLEKMRFHYDMMNELAYHVELLLPSNRIYMTNLQNEIYDSMCILKMALRSQNQDPMIRVPDGEVSDAFMEHRASRNNCDREWLEYIIGLDSLQIASYLHDMYENI